MSLSLTVKIDTAKLLAALQAAPKAVTRELRIAQGKAMTPVQREARAKHRFITRSGAAESSIGGAGPDISRSGLSSSLELKDGIASYSKYLHEGFKRRPPDQFLYRAFDNQENQIVATLEEGLRKALAKAGL